VAGAVDADAGRSDGKLEFDEPSEFQVSTEKMLWLDQDHFGTAHFRFTAALMVT